MGEVSGVRTAGALEVGEFRLLLGGSVADRRSVFEALRESGDADDAGVAELMAARSTA